MAGASVVVGVGATVVAVATVVGTVATGAGGAVVDVDVVVAEVDAVTAAVTGWTGVTGVDTRLTRRGVAWRPAKAATVPPSVPSTMTRATAPSTIRCLMTGMLRLAHQPLANAPATSRAGTTRSGTSFHGPGVA